MSAFYVIKLFTAVKLRNKLACLTMCFTGATKLSILTFSLTTFSIMTLSITIKNGDTQHNDMQNCYAECLCKVSFVLGVANKPIMLSVVILRVIMLSVFILSGIKLSVVMLNVIMLSHCNHTKCYCVECCYTE